MGRVMEMICPFSFHSGRSGMLGISTLNMTGPLCGVCVCMCVCVCVCVCVCACVCVCVCACVHVKCVCMCVKQK